MEFTLLESTQANEFLVFNIENEGVTIIPSVAAFKIASVAPRCSSSIKKDPR